MGFLSLFGILAYSTSFGAAAEEPEIGESHKPLLLPEQLIQFILNRFSHLQGS
jgi:hypothetical protein